MDRIDNPEIRVPFRERPIPEIMGILQANLGEELVAYAIGDDDTERVEAIALETTSPEEDTESVLRDLAEITEVIVVDKGWGKESLVSLMFGMNTFFDDEAPIGEIRRGGPEQSAHAVATAPYWGEMGN